MRKQPTFRGGLEFCSNFFWPCPVFYEGFEYDSSEHAFQAAKFLDDRLRERFRGKGRDAITPAGAKRLAGTLKAQGHQRPDWKQVSVVIMGDVVRQKFRDILLLRRLVDTDDLALEEGNYWHDNFWGSCTCPKCAGKPKLDHLGRILRGIRAEAQGRMPPEEIPEKP